MTKDEYKKYITSAKWIVKKAELVNDYLKNKKSICCNKCGSEYNINVHHLNYDRVGNEYLDDLCFMCKTCHHNFHFPPISSVLDKNDIERLIKAFQKGTNYNK